MEFAKPGHYGMRVCLRTGLTQRHRKQETENPGDVN